MNNEKKWNTHEMFEKTVEKIDEILSSYNKKLESLDSSEEKNLFFSTNIFILSQVLAALLAHSIESDEEIYIKMIKDQINVIRKEQEKMIQEQKETIRKNS